MTKNHKVLIRYFKKINTDYFRPNDPTLFLLLHHPHLIRGVYHRGGGVGSPYPSAVKARLHPAHGFGAVHVEQCAAAGHRAGGHIATGRFVFHHARHQKCKIRIGHWLGAD